MKKMKSFDKEIVINNFGIVAGLVFSDHKANAVVYAEASEITDIVKALQSYVHETFPKDAKYLEAIDLVVQKLERKNHSLRIIEEVLIGTQSIKFDHLAWEENDWPEDTNEEPKP